MSKSLPPDVLEALTTAVRDLGTQAAVAARLQISAAVVNHLLKDRYAGDVDKMAERIRGVFMHEVVACPVMGDLERHFCLDYQSRPLVHTNPQRARLYLACRSCPNRRDA